MWFTVCIEPNPEGISLHRGFVFRSSLAVKTLNPRYQSSGYQLALVATEPGPNVPLRGIVNSAIGVTAVRFGLSLDSTFVNTPCGNPKRFNHVGHLLSGSAQTVGGVRGVDRTFEKTPR